MVHDALAEATAEYEANPTTSGHDQLIGMRYVAGLLGMAEGHSTYEWTTGTPRDRLTLRRLVLRGRARQGPN